MITQDIDIIEGGSGGDITVVNGDIGMTNYLYNQVYLALFGGNVEAVTLGNEPDGAIREDYWQNDLLYFNQPGLQFNSLTELALQQNALSSSGRIAIQRAAETDLVFLSAIAEVTVNVVILSTNKVQIAVTLQQPANNIDVTIKFIWDNARNELITQQNIPVI
jgi:hypothetical protein